MTLDDRVIVYLRCYPRK